VKAAKVDGNSKLIVAAFRGRGCTWLDLHRVGQGCPDGLVGCNGVDRLVEIKNPDGKDQLTEDQIAFMSEWRGAVPWTVRTLEDVGECVKEMKLEAKAIDAIIAPVDDWPDE